MRTFFSSTPTTTGSRHWMPLVFLGVLAGCLTGCSLIVMTGTMLQGRPKIPSAFDEFTKKSLAENGKKTLVVCKAPLGDDGQSAALDIEMQAEISRRLKQHEIDVISSHKVANWIDDRGGQWGNPTELFDEFEEADFLLIVNVNDFSYLEKDSPGLYRGRSHIEIEVYEKNEYRSKIFTHPIESVYPLRRPVMSDRVSKTVFRKRYVDQLSTQIARLFFEHRPEENFD